MARFGRAFGAQSGLLFRARTANFLERDFVGLCDIGSNFRRRQDAEFSGFAWLGRNPATGSIRKVHYDGTATEH